MIKQITPDIYFLPGQDEFLPDSHVYLIGNRESGNLTMVDTGLVGKGAYKLKSLEKIGISPDVIKRVILTHSHLDHIGCLRELKENLPHLEVWLHEAEADSLLRGDERTVYGMEAFRTMCQAQYGLKDGDFASLIDKKLKDNELLTLDHTSWRVLHIPGHSLGSIALYEETRKILLCGDTIYSDHAIGGFDLHGASASQLKDSLFRLAALEVKMLLPGHNRIIIDLPPMYISQTVKQWAPYLK